MGWLQHARPDLVPEYERLYGRKAYLRDEDKRRTEARLRSLTRRSPGAAEMALRFQRGAPLQRSGHGVAEQQPAQVSVPARVKQESLF